MAESTMGATRGARCAEHGERAAVATCERCGNFMCEECNLGHTAAMCPRCRALTGGTSFPFSRDNWSFDGLWSHCFEAFKREWVLLSLAILILVGVEMFVGMIATIFQAVAEKSGEAAAKVVVTVSSQIVGTIVRGIVQLGIIRVAFDVILGSKADLARIGSQLWKAGRFIVQQILIGLFIGLPIVLYLLVLLAIAFFAAGLTEFDPEALLKSGATAAILGGGILVGLVPILYFTIPLTFAPMELVLNDRAGAFDGIRAAYVVAKGHRLSVFGFSLLAGLLAIAGLLACCIGIFPALAIGQLLLGGLFLALRKGSGLPQPSEGQS